MRSAVLLRVPKPHGRCYRPRQVQWFSRAPVRSLVHQGAHARTVCSTCRDQNALKAVSEHELRHLSYIARRRASTASSAAQTPKVLVNDMPNQELLIELSPGQAARYPSFWLRDHCLCSVCSHPDTHQRQHDTFTLDPAMKATSVSSTSSGLEITWSDPSNHTSLFPWPWLQRHTPFTTPTNNATTRHRQSRPWTPFLPSSPLPKTSYDAITSTPTGLPALLTQLLTHGISFIPSTPPSPAATESLLSFLGPIRNTHYDAFWDFTSIPQPIDTAYTNLSLPLHTDTTYFTDPAGLQLFHLLSHTPQDHPTNNPGDYEPTLGGESTFADGFAAAAKLHSLNPTYYNILSTIPIVFAAEGSPAGSFRNNLFSSSGSTVFTHHSNTTTKDLRPDNLTLIRFNNLDRSPLTTFPSHQAMLQWYSAAKLYSDILHSEEFLVTVPLRPGEPVVFDNWRVLHGRKAFEGRRRVCGGYVGVDDWRGKVVRFREVEGVGGL
jgi:trimethyllysine dioxygenase